MATLYYMRTHFIDESVIYEYNKLYNSIDFSSGDDCILFVDNHKKNLDVDTSSGPVIYLYFSQYNIKTLLYDKVIHDSLNLPYYEKSPYNDDLGRIMWYCSDYPFYIVRNYFPNFDYYWSIESDVFCNGKSYKKFFNKYKNNKNDLLVSEYRCVDEEEWYWKSDIDWIYTNNKVYGSFFPVVRLSKEAIDFLYHKRIEHSEIYSKVVRSSIDIDIKSKWIFCELFVPTELTNNNFSCAPISGQKLRYEPVYNLSKERIFENPDYLLYHPVK